MADREKEKINKGATLLEVALVERVTVNMCLTNLTRNAKNQTNICIVITFFILMIYVVKMRNMHKVSKCPSFETMVSKETNMEDKCLVDYVRTTRLSYPSTLPYNLSTSIDRTNLVSIAPDAFQSFLHDKDAPWVDALIAVEIFVPKVRL